MSRPCPPRFCHLNSLFISIHHILYKLSSQTILPPSNVHRCLPLLCWAFSHFQARQSIYGHFHFSGISIRTISNHLAAKQRSPLLAPALLGFLSFSSPPEHLWAFSFLQHKHKNYLKPSGRQATFTVACPCFAGLSLIFKPARAFMGIFISRA